MVGLAPKFDLLREHWGVLAATDEPGRRVLNVVAPFSGQMIAQVDVAGERHVQDALFAAFSMFRQKDRWLSVQRRIHVLKKVDQLLGDNDALLAREAARESGRALRWCRDDVLHARLDARAGIAQLQRQLTQTIATGPVCALDQDKPLVRFSLAEPIGAVVAVLGRESPLRYAARTLFAAVAAGCPVIIKPAEDVPLSCLRLVHLLHEAGLPHVWCQSVVTETHEITRQLATDPRVALFSFCGSADIGWSLRSQLSPGTRALLDHGSLMPAILTRDADLELAAEVIADSGFMQKADGGEAIRRVFVPAGVGAEFAALLKRRSEAIVIGDPLQESTELGVLTRAEGPRQTQQWVEDAANAGGEVFCGGKSVGLQGYLPTVVLDPPLDSKVSTQPVSAPLVVLHSVDSDEQACERANALPLARSALIFTASSERAAQLSRLLDATSIGINQQPGDDHSHPNGSGFRRSGLGGIGLEASLNAMQVEKAIEVAAWQPEPL